MSGVDWNNDREVVIAARPTAYSGVGDGNIFTMEQADGGMSGLAFWLGEDWQEARQHPSVVVYEREHGCCPSCGYIKYDFGLHMDHHLCKNAGNAPWETAPAKRVGEVEGAKAKVLAEFPDASFAEIDCAEGLHRILASRKDHAWRQQMISSSFKASEEDAAWLDAANKLATPPDANEMSEWISVDENLPNSSEDVIVCLRNMVMCGYLGAGSGEWWVYNGICVDGMEKQASVTHWQPLPAPPSSPGGGK